MRRNIRSRHSVVRAECSGKPPKGTNNHCNTGVSVHRAALGFAAKWRHRPVSGGFSPQKTFPPLSLPEET